MIEKVVFASSLHTSDEINILLVVTTTGETAGNHIRNFLVIQAKNGLAAGKTISEVAYDIDLEYPQHLSGCCVPMHQCDRHTINFFINLSYMSRIELAITCDSEQTHSNSPMERR